MPKSIRSCSDLTAAEIREIAAVSHFIFGVLHNCRDGALPAETRKVLRHKLVLLAFFEPSTRTRISFEIAAKTLGTDTVLFTSADSSIQKGENFDDTALTLAAMRPALFVIRHSMEGAADRLETLAGIPVVSGGEGRFQHPTQALLDAFTVHLEKPLWKNGETSAEIAPPDKPLHLAIIGDVLNSRVARSNYELWTRLGHKVTLAVPPSLINAGESSAEMAIGDFSDELLPTADVVMMLRIQRERIAGSVNKTDGELNEEFGLNVRRLKMIRDDALIMHPGPANVGVEISSEVYDDPRCRIRQQVTMGLAVRIALLAFSLDGLQELKATLGLPG